MTEIYLHIVARMADYMATHPYHRSKGVAAYPKFLLPERGVFVNPAPGGGSALPGPAAAAASKAYERYQVQLAQGVETTQRQLQAIDDRWKVYMLPNQSCAQGFTSNSRSISVMHGCCCCCRTRSRLTR